MKSDEGRDAQARAHDPSHLLGRLDRRGRRLPGPGHRRPGQPGPTNASGGIGGRPIRVKVGDDANDPEKHLRLVREMVEQERVVAFAGMPAVDTQGASVKYLESKGIPVVGGVIGNQVWGRAPSSSRTASPGRRERG